jgi:sRNA-binding carbon storage regulator CsrA|tara:strand:- start:941 stop:1189 length:249 start_codon:yes stop_codon:yes gene_type:complete
MLLLQRHQNESIVIHPEGEPDKPLVVRVTEVLPTGDVTLGFIGRNYKVIRQEIFNPSTAKGKGIGMEITTENKYETKGNYYS